MISSQQERQAATVLRQKYFFDRVPIKDPYLWTFDHKDHLHFILCLGNEIVGYAHVQLWPGRRAAIRIIVIEEQFRGSGLGKRLLAFCEKVLKEQGVKMLHTESRPKTTSFYKNLGYVEMPFNDPEGVATDPHDIAMGKEL